MHSLPCRLFGHHPSLFRCLPCVSFLFCRDRRARFVQNIRKKSRCRSIQWSQHKQASSWHKHKARSRCVKHPLILSLSLYPLSSSPALLVSWVVGGRLCSGLRFRCLLSVRVTLSKGYSMLFFAIHWLIVLTALLLFVQTTPQFQITHWRAAGIFHTKKSEEQKCTEEHIRAPTNKRWRNEEMKSKVGGIKGNIDKLCKTPPIFQFPTLEGLTQDFWIFSLLSLSLTGPCFAIFAILHS